MKTRLQYRPSWLTGARIAIAGAVIGSVIVLLANAHFVYLALASQPTCVTHILRDPGDAHKAGFAAAESACAP